MFGSHSGRRLAGRIKGQNTICGRIRIQKTQKIIYPNKEIVSLCVLLYCRRPSNVRRPFLWFFCFHYISYFSNTQASERARQKKIQTIRIIICVDPYVSANSQLPRTYYSTHGSNRFFRIYLEKKNEEKTVSFYILGIVSVAREVYCTQRRKSALVRELRWISFTFNFVCI